MLSASHIDRLRKRPNYQRFLSLEAIQKRICNGKDLYDMLPEVYSWGDLINFWGGARHEGWYILAASCSSKLAKI